MNDGRKKTARELRAVFHAVRLPANAANTNVTS
jgi:hypothetical protein